MFEQHEKNAAKLYYIISMTYEALKQCGMLDNDLFTKDINNDDQKMMIMNVSLDEIRKTLKI